MIFAAHLPFPLDLEPFQVRVNDTTLAGEAASSHSIRTLATVHSIECSKVPQVVADA